MKHLTLLAICASLLLAAAPYHIERGAQFGTEAAEAYARSRHGGDGEIFLDGYIRDYLQRAGGGRLIDIGCGAGPWGIEAAQLGVDVLGVDLEPAMIERALLAATDAGVAGRTKWIVGDVSALPVEEGLFDHAISINVGCCLPELKAHTREAARVVKPGGTLLVTAPASFGVLFTDDSGVLDIPSRLKRTALAEIASIYRATFVEDSEGLRLIQDEAELTEGEPIWRKIPGLVVPNYYHGEKAYLDAMESAGLVLVAIHRPSFSSEQERTAYYTWNQMAGPHLGSAYVGNPPFVIFELQKP